MFRPMILAVLCMLILGSVASSYAKSGQTALVVRVSNLKATASFAAKTIKQVKLGYTVKVLKKRGGWVYVQGTRDKARGWLRGYQIRSNISSKQLQVAQKRSSNSSPLADISRSTTALFGSNKQNKNEGVVATLGVRGLSEADLQNAKPNPVELKKMQSYASNKQLAIQFANQGKLKGAK